MNTAGNTNQKPRRRWLYGIPLVLLLAAAGSILYFEHAEREYEIGITGCESGGIELTDAGIFCGSLTILRGRGDGTFSLSLQAEESTTSLALYKLEQNPAAPAAPPLAQVAGNKEEDRF